MAAPQIGALPAISSPAVGQPGLGAELGSGLAGMGDAARQDQLKKMLFQQQMIKASQDAQNAIAQQINNSPNGQQAYDPQTMKTVQALYDRLGIKAPIGPIPQEQTGAQGDAGIAAQPRTGVEVGALGSGQAGFNEWAQKNWSALQELPADQRLNAARMAGFTPSGQQLTALTSGAPALTEKDRLKQEDLDDKRDKVFGDQFDAQFKTAMQSHSPGAMHAVIESNIGRARNHGWSDQKINDVFEPLLQAHLNDLNPLQVAQMEKDQEMTDEMKQLLQPKIAELHAQTAARNASVSHMNQLTSNLKTVGQYLPATLRAQANGALARANASNAAASRDYDMADWYSQRTTDDVNGGSPGDRVRMFQVLQTAQQSKLNTASQLDQAVLKFQGSLGAMDPQNRAQTQQYIDQAKKQADALRTEANGYQTTIQNFSSGLPSGMAAPGAPSVGGGTGGVHIMDPVTGLWLPQTKMGPKGMGYLWADGQYHYKPNPSGQ